MLIQTKAIIIKENNVGETDRLVTMLTEKAGVIRAFARGARNVKSKALSATRLFCYSEMSIWASADKYVIREAEPIEVFFGLRDDIVKIALAGYFSQLLIELAPSEENAADYLKLLLNCLYFLEKGQKPTSQLKAIFELRLLSMAGYMPALEACAGCGAFESSVMYFVPQSGELYCDKCHKGGEALNMSVVSAMRYIIYAQLKQVFSFTLSDEALGVLSDISEKFLLCQTQKNFSALEFYNTVK
ncbi:MAG: DNA repair protein RecO [Clostridia bacterium]|nr:DNA repair protein RecO [Clostridia bacterium]